MASQVRDSGTTPDSWVEQTIGEPQVPSRVGALARDTRRGDWTVPRRRGARSSLRPDVAVAAALGGDQPHWARCRAGSAMRCGGRDCRLPRHLDYHL